MVCAVMLTKDRPEMARRAVECFRAQTYPNKRLVVVNGGFELTHAPDVVVGAAVGNLSIGEMRNRANAFAILTQEGSAKVNPEVFMHWDDDDWSAPERMAEQVALLQSSGADAVGYNQMLFYDQTPGQFAGAWMYHNRDPRYALGTSLCYWRKTWERKPFPDTSIGEDTQWIMGMKLKSEPAVRVKVPEYVPFDDSMTATFEEIIEPRMVARIHGGNTSSRIIPAAEEWQRAAGWDQWCRETMSLCSIS